MMVMIGTLPNWLLLCVVISGMRQQRCINPSCVLGTLSLSPHLPLSSLSACCGRPQKAEWRCRSHRSHSLAFLPTCHSSVQIIGGSELEFVDQTLALLAGKPLLWVHRVRNGAFFSQVKQMQDVFAMLRSQRAENTTNRKNITPPWKPTAKKNNLNVSVRLRFVFQYKIQCVVFATDLISGNAENGKNARRSAKTTKTSEQLQGVKSECRHDSSPWRETNLCARWFLVCCRVYLKFNLGWFLTSSAHLLFKCPANLSHLHCEGHRWPARAGSKPVTEADPGPEDVGATLSMRSSYVGREGALVSLADALRLLQGLSAFYNPASTTGWAVDYFCTENSEERLDLSIELGF